MACGRGFSVAVSSTGQAFSWGSAEHGRLGQGDQSDHPEPTAITGLAGRTIARVSCGSAHAMVTTDTGQVWVWGSADRGRLGLGPNRIDDVLSPTLLEGPWVSPVLDVGCGHAHSILVDARGQVYAWGSNKYGQLGVECSHHVVGSNGNGVGVCGDRSNDKRQCSSGGGGNSSVVWCCTSSSSSGGNNGNGGDSGLMQCSTSGGGGGKSDGCDDSSIVSCCASGSSGGGSTCSSLCTCCSYVPVRVDILHGCGSGYGSGGYGGYGDGSCDVLAISAGAYHNAALTDQAQIVTWGRNNHGQLVGVCTVGVVGKTLRWCGY